MKLPDTTTICRDLSQFLASEILPGETRITPDAVLADLGVDSFALMEVVLFIERRYGVVLPMDRLTREHVRSVRSLSGCLTELSA